MHQMYLFRFHFPTFCLLIELFAISSKIFLVDAKSSYKHQHRCKYKYADPSLGGLALAFAASTPTPKSKGKGKGPKPISSEYWPSRFPAQDHCSKCGLCETSYVKHVKTSCAFLDEGMARIDELEERVHGSRRTDHENKNGMNDNDGHFGVLNQPILLARGVEVDAQWSGVVTGIAISMLESEMVDAVVCIASGDNDNDKDGNNDEASSPLPAMASSSEPVPILARTVEELQRGKGVKPALAPSLRILDEVRDDPSIRRLLFCGVGCAVQAFRALQNDPEAFESLGLDEDGGVFVLGTNCADNSPSQAAARNFISEGIGIGENNVGDVMGYEFMQDFKVHVKMRSNGSDVDSGGPKSKEGKNRDTYLYEKMPYFCLPGSIAQSSIADSCKACFDYTNALADVVVGYMGAPIDKNFSMNTSYQTLAIRNDRGMEMVHAALERDTPRISLHGEAQGSGSYETFVMSTVENDAIVMSMAGQTPPEEGMPKWIGNIVAVIVTRLSPKGMNFARYSIDYHLLRNYLYILYTWGEERAELSVPLFAKVIVGEYLKSSRSFRELKDAVLEQREL